MNVSAAPADRATFRLTSTTVAVLSLAALLWVGVIAWARDLGNGRGTMGMAPTPFLAMWTLMMTAMMLPAVAPVASLYAQTIRTRRATRIPMFVAGYVLAWALVGVPAFAVLRTVDHVAADSDAAMRSVVIVVLVAAGMYQLTPLKARCLRHCRSPLAQLLHFGNFKGRGVDPKVALHHAGYCLGCCWALMLLFVAFGIMSVWAMVGLAVVVFAEKLGRHGETLARGIGIACFALAALVALSPAIAHNLIPASDMPTMTSRT